AAVTWLSVVSHCSVLTVIRSRVASGLALGDHCRPISRARPRGVKVPVNHITLTAINHGKKYPHCSKRQQSRYAEQEGKRVLKLYKAGVNEVSQAGGLSQVANGRCRSGDLHPLHLLKVGWRKVARWRSVKEEVATPEDSKRALNTIAETAVRMFDANSVNIRRIEGDVLRIIAAAGPMAPRPREALPDIPLEPTDPSVRCFFDNRQRSSLSVSLN